MGNDQINKNYCKDITELLSLCKRKKTIMEFHCAAGGG